MISYILGESRPLEFEITHQNGDPFTIRDAQFNLYKDDNCELIESGSMTIDGHLISYIFTPQERGRFVFDLSYMIGDTVRKARYKIKVD